MLYLARTHAHASVASDAVRAEYYAGNAWHVVATEERTRACTVPLHKTAWAWGKPRPAQGDRSTHTWHCSRAKCSARSMYHVIRV